VSVLSVLTCYVLFPIPALIVPFFYRQMSNIDSLNEPYVFCFFEYACLSQHNFLARNKMYTHGSILNMLSLISLLTERVPSWNSLSSFQFSTPPGGKHKQVEIGMKYNAFLPLEKQDSQSEMMSVCVFSVFSEKAWDFRGVVSAHTPKVQQHCR